MRAKADRSRSCVTAANGLAAYSSLSRGIKFNDGISNKTLSDLKVNEHYSRFLLDAKAKRRMGGYRNALDDDRLIKFRGGKTFIADSGHRRPRGFYAVVQSSRERANAQTNVRLFARREVKITPLLIYRRCTRTDCASRRCITGQCNRETVMGAPT